MKKIYLVRHAESEANIGKVFKNVHTIRITPAGKKQAENLKRKIKNPTLIIVSKYIRTIETAEPTIKKFKDVPVMLWPQIHEFNYIDNVKLKALDLESLMEKGKWYWEEADPFYSDGDDVESFSHFVDRIHDAIMQLKKLEGVVYVFTHGYVIRMVLLLTSSYQNFDALKKKKGKKVFYKDLMKEFRDFHVTNKKKLIKNTEVLDFTEGINSFT